MKLSATLLLLFSAGASAAVPSLDDENWEDMTAGKTVFVKFFAPWCGHCKSMASDWEKLSDEWAGNAVGLVAEVDCTMDDTEDICEENNIEGFPTIKFGDPTALEDYEGQRDYDAMAAFAKENLKPVCSPKNLDACDDEKKGIIEKYQAMTVEDLDAAIDGVEKQIEDADNKRDEEVEKLQETYERLMEEHDVTTKRLKVENNIGLMKAVKATLAETKDEL